MSDGARRPHARRLLGLLRWTVVLLPLAFVLRGVDVAAIAGGIRRVGAARLALGLLGQIGISVIVSLRWRIMLRTYGGAVERLPSVRTLLGVNLVANYYALLPVPVADEALRAVRTASVFPDRKLTPYVVLAAERVVGLVGLLLLGSFGVLATRTSLSTWPSRLLGGGITVVTVLAVPVLMLPRLIASRPSLRTRIEAWPGPLAWLASVPVPERARDIASAVILSILGHFGSCLVILWLFVAIDPSVGLSTCVRTQPLVLLAMALPLTYAGVGQREIAFIVLYGLAGVSRESALAVSFSSFVLAMAQAAVGGGVALVDQSSRDGGTPPGDADISS